MIRNRQISSILTIIAYNSEHYQILHSMLFIQEIKNSDKNNILTMFKYVIFDDFESMLLQKLTISTELNIPIYNSIYSIFDNLDPLSVFSLTG